LGINVIRAVGAITPSRVAHASPSTTTALAQRRVARIIDWIARGELS
jgi:hypothetical protein